MFIVTKNKLAIPAPRKQSVNYQSRLCRASQLAKYKKKLFGKKMQQ
jgi:hypothetical protein